MSAKIVLLGLVFLLISSKEGQGGIVDEIKSFFLGKYVIEGPKIEFRDQI